MRQRSDSAAVRLGMPEFVVGAQLAVGRLLWLIVETTCGSLVPPRLRVPRCWAWPAGTEVLDLAHETAHEMLTGRSRRRYDDTTLPNTSSEVSPDQTVFGAIRQHLRVWWKRSTLPQVFLGARGYAPRDSPLEVIDRGPRPSVLEIDMRCWAPVG
jgi:hypothetical protein